MYKTKKPSKASISTKKTRFQHFTDRAARHGDLWHKLDVFLDFPAKGHPFDPDEIKKGLHNEGRNVREHLKVLWSCKFKKNFKSKSTLTPFIHLLDDAGVSLLHGSVKHFLLIYCHRNFVVLAVLATPSKLFCISEFTDDPKINLNWKSIIYLH